MPVVRIRALPQPRAELPAVAGAVSTALAAELDEPPHGTWVTWETVEVYAEGAETPTAQPRATHPPLVSVRARAGRSQETIERMLRCVGDTLVRELDLEAGNVFVTYDEVGEGELYDAAGFR